MLHIASIILDELTADPTSPEEGQVWCNTTTKEYKGYINGQIEVFAHVGHLHLASQIDTDQSGQNVQNHIDDKNNPHAVEAEQIDTTETGKTVQDKINDLESAPAGGTLASVQLRRTTLYSMTASWTDLPFDATDVETDPTVLEHNNTNTERIDIKATGTYLFSFRFDVAGMADARIYKNGTIQLTGSLCQNADEIIGTVVASCIAGDYVTVQVQSSPPKDITINSDIIFNAILLNGVIGATGAQGAQGIQGIQGDSGLLGVWQGTWVSQNYVVNDIVEYLGSSYICILNTVSSEVPTNTTYWDLTTQKGDTGAQGVQGDKGLNWQGTWTSQNYVTDDAVEYLGSAYVCHTDTVSNEIPTDTNYWDLLAQKGDTGDTGSQGIQGDQGIQGIQGIQGDKGLTWQGAWVSQNYVVDDAVEYLGSAYICILNTVSSENPSNATYWDLLAQKGDTGSQGIQGDTGPAGSNGTDGKTVLNGTVVPTTEGVDGDFYIRTDTDEIYGPKTGGSWGSPTSLVGPTGSNGSDGADGKTVLNGTVVPTTEGVDGDFYIRTDTDEIYGPKTSGSWGSPTSLIGPTGPAGDGNTSIDITMDKQTNSTSYVILRRVIFAGTTALGTPSKIKAIADSVTSASIKIYDVTNSQTICELTGLSSGSPAIHDLGTLSNLPTGEAIFEIQGKKDSTTLNIYGINFQF